MTASRGLKARTNSSRAAPAHAHDLRQRCSRKSGRARAWKTIRVTSTGAVPTPPHTLLDYFPDDFLLIIDESRDRPDRRCSKATCRASAPSSTTASACPRRWTTVLKWDEFTQPRPTIITYPRPRLSSSPDGVVEQIVAQRVSSIRSSVVKPTEDRSTTSSGWRCACASGIDERVLVTTLLMAEELTTYLAERGVKVEYLHSNVDTLRVDLAARELRLGTSDVLVGINLLRGARLPEVSLIAHPRRRREGFSLHPLAHPDHWPRRETCPARSHVRRQHDGLDERAVSEVHASPRDPRSLRKEHGIDPQPLRKRDLRRPRYARRRQVDTQTPARGRVPQGEERTRPQCRAKAPAVSNPIGRRGGQNSPNSSKNSLPDDRRSAPPVRGLPRLRDEIEDLKKELRAVKRAH